MRDGNLSQQRVPVKAALKKRPQKETSSLELPDVVSLFAGAGGLDLGFKDAGYQVKVAFDISSAAIRSHKKNFPGTHSLVADLIKLGPEGVVEVVRNQIAPGKRIGVIGGPPCQGFSRANAGSLANDPRNQLPSLYLQIVEKLQEVYIVEFLVLENVLGIRDKKHARTYNALVKNIAGLGFEVTEKELCAVDFGIPQLRRRIVLSGVRAGQGYTKVKPRKRKGLATVHDAIGGLVEPAFFKHGIDQADIPHHPNHWTMRPRSPKFTNPEHDFSEGRSFKKLDWQSASPTIAFGHREIHVHPSGRRRLSIYEAMLLQGFPHEFILLGNLSEQVEQVSNAVPPRLGRSIAQAVTRSLNRL